MIEASSDILKDIGFVETYEGLCQTKTHIIDSNMTIQYNMCLPAYLSPVYWLRHRLSANDVFHIMHETTCIDLWALAALLGIEISASCIKISFANVDDVLLSGKANCMKRIAGLFKLTSHDKLLQTPNHHIPRIPVYTVGKGMFDALKIGMTPSYDQVVMLDNYIDFIHLKWIFIGMEITGALLMRIVPQDVFVGSGRDVQQGRSNSPYVVNIRGSMFVTVNSECININIRS